MKSILITGCNRGLGLGLVKHIAQSGQNVQHILATCRNPDAAAELKKIAEQYKNIRIFKTDLKNENDIKNLAKEVASVNGVNENGLDVVFNNAGIATKFGRIGTVKADQLIENFQVNTVGAVLVTKALAPLLKKAVQQNNVANGNGTGIGIVVNVSSILGSITENKDGGYYPYRLSKAALNAATKSMSIDLKGDGITVISLHPGWLKTDMGGAKAPLTVDEVVPKIISFVQNLQQSKHSGCFFSYDGSQMPW